MNKNDPIWWAAKVLRHALTRVACSVDSQLRQEMRSLLEHQQAIQNCWRRCELAESRGWHLAAALEQRRLIELVPTEQYYINNILQQSPERQLQTPVPGLRDLLAELAQLHQEFDRVIIEPTRSLIAVRTDAITLKDIDLGRFQIELYLDRLAERLDSGAIDIVALDPNSPSSNDQVTHPHVSDLALCPGDASAPIRSALKEGRLCDVFLLVQGVLSTYNPASAYVALEEWSGVACGECGYSCNPDDLFYCPACHNDFCESCISVCDECEDSFCGSCLEREQGTRRSLCPNCRSVCPECDHVALASEVEEHGMCRACRDEQEREERGREEDQQQRKDQDHEEPEQNVQAHAA